jgi:hypothetical protein
MKPEESRMLLRESLKATHNHLWSYALTVISSIAIGQPLRAIVIPVPDGTTVECGRGYDTIRHEFNGFPGQGTCTVPTADSQKTFYSLYRLETTDELRESLGFSASASFTSASGSVRATYRRLQETIVSDTGLVVALEETITNTPVVTLTPRNLRDAAISVWKKQGENEFARRYGDSFVISQTYGGRLVTLVELHTHSYQYREQVAGQVKGELGTFSASAEAQQRLERISKLAQTRLVLYRAGSLDELPSATEVVKYAEGFTKSIRSNPTIINVEAIPYYQADNWPADRKSNINYKNASDQLARLGDLRDKLLKVSGEVKFRRERRASAFDKDGQKTLSRLTRDIDDSLARVAKSASEIFDRPYDQHTIPSIDVDVLTGRLPKPLWPLSLSARAQTVDQFGSPKTVDLGSDPVAWAGSGGYNDPGIQSFSLDLTPHVKDLSVRYEARTWVHSCPDCPYSLATATETGNDGDTVFAPTSGFPEHRLAGVRIWLDGTLAAKYAVRYRVCSGGVGVGPERQDGQWAYLVTMDSGHSLCGIQVWFEYRE